MITLNLRTYILVGIVLLAFATATILLQEPFKVQGSMNGYESYQSTTTSGTVASTWTVAKTVTGTSTPRTGVFGSVTITKQTNTILNIYDATTSDVTKRTGNKATSSIMLASFGTNTPAGTYTFDTTYTIQQVY